MASSWILAHCVCVCIKCSVTAERRTSLFVFTAVFDSHEVWQCASPHSRWFRKIFFADPYSKNVISKQWQQRWLMPKVKTTCSVQLLMLVRGSSKLPLQLLTVWCMCISKVNSIFNWQLFASVLLVANCGWCGLHTVPKGSVARLALLWCLFERAIPPWVVVLK